MPFNGSGDFSRVHNWQQDRDNGIKILALRMDQEFDNFQGGMNLTFLRNGLVPMTANLNLGTNYIIGLGSGSVGALPIRFADDPNTGLFLNGYNKLGLVSNGVMRLEANTGGISTYGTTSVNGALNASGAITQAGQQVWHAGNLVNPVTTAGATFVGGVSAPLFQIDPNYTMNLLSGNPLMVYDTNDYQYYDRTSNIHGFAVAGVDRFTLNSTGASITGTLSATGAITQAGNQVWHAGNFNPANYAPLAGAAFTGPVSSIYAGNAVLTTGTSTNGSVGVPAYSDLLLSGGSGNSLVGRVRGINRFQNFSETSMEFALRNSSNVEATVLTLTGNGTMSTPGSFNAVGAITQNGNQVWHAGNFNPTNYAALTGATFTGPVGFNIANFNATNDGAGNPIFNMDAGADFFGYNRAGNFYDFLIAGNSRLQVGATGASTNGTFSATGAITQAGNQVWHAGNFTPSNYAPIANPVFTGTATAPMFRHDANSYFQLDSGNVYLGYDSGDYSIYSRSGNTLTTLIGNTARTTVNATGFIVNGSLSKQGAGEVLSRATGGLSATVTQGTAAPSGGSDGDIYLQYT